MRPQDFRDHLRKQPFEPFRLTLTDGRTYDVLHPELAMVGHSTVAVGLCGQMPRSRCTIGWSRSRCCTSCKSSRSCVRQPPEPLPQGNSPFHISSSVKSSDRARVRFAKSVHVVKCHFVLYF